MVNAVYIHIPFCKRICNYCDFPKVLFSDEWANKYLEVLAKEIKRKYQGEPIKTIYIGGGTPSALNLKQIEYLMTITDLFDKTILEEFTFECNIENINIDLLKLLKNRGVNRLSIGLQTFSKKMASNLNRPYNNINLKESINLVKKYFTNFSIDLIYALPNQTMQELKKDLLELINLKVPHIATYSLMIEPNTIMSIKNVNGVTQELDYEMYQTICQTLKENNYTHYEVSNFSKPGFESKHNLVYWHNERYYGFGMGASGFLKNTRYQNTKSINNYLDGKTIINKEILSKKKLMSYEMILNLRLLKGISDNDFFSKYQKHIDKVFDVNELSKDQDLYFILEENIYQMNDILIKFI